MSAVDSKLQQDADAELAMAAAASAASRALRAGERAPLFTLRDAAGREVSLDELLGRGPVVLHFFRGAWCTFGEQSVAELAATYRDVAALGATAVAIAPPPGSGTREDALPIHALHDIDMKVARAYGLAFDLPVGLRARYAELGYVPPVTRRAGAWLVPIPATYLLDRNGIVALAFIDVDYRKRFEPESLVIALRALHGRRAGAR